MGNHLAVGGMAFLALAMLGAIFLISAVVFGVPTAAVAVLDIGVLFAWFWYGQPLRRQRHGSSPKGSRGTSSPLFTEVRGIEVLRTSPLRSSKKFSLGMRNASA
jgi:hypothetical protein